MHVFACRSVRTDIGWESKDCPKGEQVSVNLACNFCSLAGLVFEISVPVLLAPRGKHGFLLSLKC